MYIFVTERFKQCLLWPLVVAESVRDIDETVFLS